MHFKPFLYIVVCIYMYMCIKIYAYLSSFTNIVCVCMDQKALYKSTLTQKTTNACRPRLLPSAISATAPCCGL